MVIRDAAPGSIRSVLLQLLRELDEAAAGSPRAFYDRICEGICTLTEIERCALLLYDPREKRVVPAGSSGIPEEMVAELHGTLEETPIAARALQEDRVIVTSSLAGAIPARHLQLPGVRTLACVPVAAGDRWLGVILGDRGGGNFELSPEQRDLVWSLGKTAALAASARVAIAQQERSKLLAERVALAREVHDRVVQRLFGVSMVLGADGPLSPAERERVSGELQAAVQDLQAAMQREGTAPGPAAPSPSVAVEVERLRGHYPAVPFVIELDAELADSLPRELDTLAQSVLAEALHNADKHASPSEIGIRARRDGDAFELEITNDGVAFGSRGRGTGMGLKLAAFEALQRGGVLEFGPAGSGRWRVRLLLPWSET